jgi:hypothetical protein
VGRRAEPKRSGRGWTTWEDFGESGKVGTVTTLGEVVNDGGGGLGDGAEEDGGSRR